jgi:hypothetical protein
MRRWAAWSLGLVTLALVQVVGLMKAPWGYEGSRPLWALIAVAAFLASCWALARAGRMR